ncbi:Na+/H+ antiporter NhaC [Halopenitus malekzadehii]|uniref:Na+/H+ antiporter NhaC n=1 Tax=Halopenitus malekzadehii TaxID=1267564 RepID=A0A1H6IAZ8_9EURY|nr:Na+/H+ antiporter NhaC family protein [Halopenitus malekzadehii]SEH45827.1 Na+/H+ antiporter NhaC [Halopenitus malekzadehii]
MVEFGAASLIPPVLAIALAIVTRKAVLSLFLGIWSGGVIQAGGPTLLGDPVGWVSGVVAAGFGFFPAFDWIIAAIAGEFHATIIVFTLLLGSGVAMVWNLGGSYAIRDWALKRLTTQRKAGVSIAVLGVILFFDDYANTAIVGSSMKDVSDRLRISREKLSYLVDSTAAPVATLGISSWVAFQLSLISDGYEAAGVSDHPPVFEVFVNSIPFNMYAILAIVMVFVIVLSGRDYGEMLTAEHRSWSTGKVNREEARPMQDVAAELGDPSAANPRLINFFGPVAVLIVVTLIGALWTGGFTLGGFLADPTGALWDGVTNAAYDKALLYGSFAMVVTGFVLGKVYGIFGLGEATDTTIDGFGIMLTAVSILSLAWGIGEVVSALGTGEYVAGVAEGVVNPAILPALVLVIAAFMAFSTGTSWGTMGILTPIVIPVAWSITGGGAAGHTLVAVMVGTIFSGSIFGDHTSPISDTTVLSATFTGADLIDHVRTQLYYAGTVGIVAIVLLLVWGYVGISPLVLLPIGAVVLVGLVYGLSEFDARRRGISPIAANTPREDVEEMDADADAGAE